LDQYPFGNSSWGSNFEQLVPYLETTNARDYEIHMTPVIMKDLRQRDARGDMELVHRIAGSQHMTFPVSGITGFVLRTAGRSVVSSKDSIKCMGYLQRRLPYAVPAAVYVKELPDWIHDTENKFTIDRLFQEQTFEGTGPFPFSVEQPRAELYQRYNVKSNEDTYYAFAR
jgi:hypothetical protein